MQYDKKGHNGWLMEMLWWCSKKRAPLIMTSKPFFIFIFIRIFPTRRSPSHFMQSVIIIITVSYRRIPSASSPPRCAHRIVLHTRSWQPTALFESLAIWAPKKKLRARFLGWSPKKRPHQERSMISGCQWTA